MLAVYLLFYFFVLVKSSSFQTHQPLHVQKNQTTTFRYNVPYKQQPYLAYYSHFIQPGNNGYPKEAQSSASSSDIDRQYNQQWQISIPNQQQGGVVWVSAPQYGYAPPQSYPYPASPEQPVGLYPVAGPLKDTVVPTGAYWPSSPAAEGSVNSSPWTPIGSTSAQTTSKPKNATNPLLQYCKKPRGQFQSRECSKYVNCWDGAAVEQSCNDGLAFNEEKQWCDFSENVPGCGNVTVPTPAPGSNLTSPNTTTPVNPFCPDSFGTYRNTKNCAAFYVCVYGDPVHFFCPPGTAFSEKLKVCDYLPKVDCKGTPVIQPLEYNNTTSGSPISSSYPTPSSYPQPSTSTTQSSSTYSAGYFTQLTSTIPPVPVTPGSDPVPLYDLNLQNFPEGVVNTGVRCYQSHVVRLTPDCSAVTICKNGFSYIVNCGQATSFDAQSHRCVATFRARC